jgi:Xaa-Pro aminopeptidase
MALDIAQVQHALAEDRLDGWLLYDFHGSNPIARALVGLNGGGKMTTRRWYYLVPASGEPRGLVHAIEPHTLDGLPGSVEVYGGREALATGLDRLVGGLTRVAMEYSPESAIPYIGRVDAGTVESIRRRGVDVVSSGDLVQRFEAVWDQEALESHLAASAALYRIKDRAFAALAERTGQGVPTTEYQLQQLMKGWLGDEGLVSDAPPVVGSMENAANPHYMPSPDRSRTIGANELVLLDLWGKRAAAGAVYADITWVGFTGASVPAEFASAFEAAARARDAAVALVQRAARAGTDLRGWQVDRAAREVLQAAGFGSHILHRTGHSLGTEVHGNGVHMDDYETHDDRRLLPGTAFTLEPGLYFDRFGVRTEINVFFGGGEARVSGPAQTAILTLGT